MHYTNFGQSTIVEPVGGGLNYSLSQTKPLKFYEQVLNQDVVKKSVFKDLSATLDITQGAITARDKTQDISHYGNLLDTKDLTRSPMKGSHMLDASFYTGRKHKLPLTYQEETSKRHVGHIIDETKVKIEEAHRNRSKSPRKEGYVPLYTQKVMRRGSDQRRQSQKNK